MSKAYDIIEESIERILELMDFDAVCSIKEEIDTRSDKKVYACTIKTEKDSRFLIGHRGANLYALEHIVRSILYRNKFSDRVSVDINGYKEDKDRMIVNIAKDAADQAYREKKPVVLRPMNAYERRIVHMTIGNDSRVETESIGENGDRKVVVKPQSIMESL
jgi:spoIIIJ-associated protein